VARERTVEDKLTVDVVIAIVDEIGVNVVHAEREVISALRPEEIVRSFDGVRCDLQAFAGSASAGEGSVDLNKDVVGYGRRYIDANGPGSDEIGGGVTADVVSGAIEAERVDDVGGQRKRASEGERLCVVIERRIRSEQKISAEVRGLNVVGAEVTSEEGLLAVDGPVAAEDELVFRL